MGILARIDRKMFDEIKRIQERYRENGIDISFAEASRIYRESMKKIKRTWKFPEFT